MTKFLFTFSVCCILLLTLLHQVNAGPTDPVSIPDAALRAAIETKLGKNSGDTITESEMNGMTGVLATNFVSVNDLTGLEHATSITQLKIQNNTGEITSLSPLTNLTNLTILLIHYYKTETDPSTTLSDISPLTNLTNLTQLQLAHNSIVDITPLKNLTHLTDLHLDNNSITDISSLAGLTNLTTLFLTYNNITDISPLGSLIALTHLELKRNTGLSNISAVASLTNLSNLDLQHTGITKNNLSAVLPSLPALQWLYIGRTSISDLSVLDRFPSGTVLEVLDLQYMSSDPNGAYLLERGDGRGKGWLLTDISPLVNLMNAGKVIAGDTREINLIWNWGLDYESLYTDIPALRAGGVPEVRYPSPTPRLERESAENHVGRPGTRHTFVVQAYNSTTESWGHTLVNDRFAKVPVTWTVTAPDGSTQTEDLTGDDGLARVTITLGNDGETHRAEAVVRAKTTSVTDLQHQELKVSFTATADHNAPIVPDLTVPGLTVTFEDYPEDRPTDEFTLTIKFSEPVIGFQEADITVETELTTGTGTATLEELTPTPHGIFEPVTVDQTELIPDTLEELTRPTVPAQTYTARIGLPTRASGTLKLIVRARAALSTFGQIGPAGDTASEPIEFGRRGPLVFPSYVAMDKVIFNELRNVEDDTNDWIELKNISDEAVSLKEWEISMVASEDEPHYVDRDIVEFPDWTLPPSGILLIVNTEPSETDLIHGQNLEHPNHNPKLRPWYLIRPEMKLPQTPYLLILRNARDKNGKWEGFEDLVGDYHRGDVNYRTQIWPLRDTWVYTGTGARLSEAEAWQRVMRPKGAIPMKPMERGYFHNAWVVNHHQSGLGYDPDASPETSFGTPGYATLMEDDVGTGHISFSEVMFATNERGLPSQWVELYNNSATEIVDLEGWKLVIEVRDSQPVHRYTTFHFKPLVVMPNQTVLLVTRHDRNSENIPARRIYDVRRQNRKALLLRSEGFALRLFSPDGTLVDMAGNLNGRIGQDKPRWELPSGWSESGVRSSLIRRYEDRVPWQGTVPGSWVRAADTALLLGYSYWGLPTDNGTPGYRRGSPLPVELSSFRADLQEGAVVVNWTTASEMETAGFYVLRSQQSRSDFVRVNPALIPGAGTTAEGQTYTYRDTTATVNVPYYYRLEEVSLSGERRAVATVRLRGYVSAANKLLWKWVDVKFAE